MAINADLLHQIKQAKKDLAAAGWNHICTTMNDGGTKDYGLVYTRNGEKFYLNIETVNNVWRKTL